MQKETYCPCSPEQLYRDCCQPYHNGTKIPSNAEQLMRSRYSAYAMNLSDYIVKTWAPITCPPLSTADMAQTRWIKLLINKSWEVTKDEQAFVDFDAFYEHNGQMHRMHEVSRFIKSDGRWYYLDGKVS